MDRKALLFLFLLITLALLSACGSSYRNGVGPYDFTDYAANEARQEIREAQIEMTKYPYDDYLDMLWSESATQQAQDALDEYYYQLYLQEKESGQ